ncbi:pentatricopeptide repeat-containing protein At2g34400-like [Selaginella moellendorffii]|uniref:pentatricopeptide repeat-containing protein At2g34400-like n=1 Tax=Selaginella moellendorffii TaxID=88036 RepID=UPI000D1CAFF3|nr:pentatricopeptide repeat-containing protein At2g34400-like [Selaginella moellendorffii]|eukprot:XP_024526522.1 pentatricopeptide repeat-containing protein At2g34400-like [Selaginella moellendorffii]
MAVAARRHRHLQLPEDESNRRRELHKNQLFQASRSISRLAKQGNVADARALFDRIPRHDLDAAVWNALILAYATNAQGEIALELFSRMECEPDARTFVAAIKACLALAAGDPAMELELDGVAVKARALEIGMDLHARAARSYLDVRDKFVANVLIDMYARCGSVVDSSQVFFRMENPDIVSWTSLILGHAESGDGEAGLELFERMVGERNVYADSRAYVAAVKSCTKISAREEKKILGGDGKAVKIRCLERGFALHLHAAKNGRLDRDTFVATSLCDMYANFGSMDDAVGVFSRITRRDIISWNAMLLGYAENGHGRRAVELFLAMVCEGFKPNDRTFVAAFKACSSMAVEEQSSEVDRKAVKIASLETGMAIHSFGAATRDDIYVTTSLLDMYTKCNSMPDARRVFDKMAVRALVTWNSLLLGYAESGESEMALELLERMILVERISPDARTYGAALKACGGKAALQLGKALHAGICRTGSLENNSSLAGCLVDFYSRCGSINEACQVFHSIDRNDTVTWSSLLAGLSRQGSVHQVLSYFQSMLDEGVEPDGITFLSVISSCGHAGLVERGMEYFQVMSSSYGIQPGLEHYHCVIDLLGRANRLEEAVAMVDSMPVRPTGLTWTTVLAAGCRWKNFGVAKLAFESLLEASTEVVEVGYVLMANLYGSLGMWDARKEVFDALARGRGENNTEELMEMEKFS